MIEFSIYWTFSERKGIRVVTDVRPLSVVSTKKPKLDVEIKVSLLGGEY